MEGISHIGTVSEEEILYNLNNLTTENAEDEYLLINSENSFSGIISNGIHENMSEVEILRKYLGKSQELFQLVGRCVLTSISILELSKQFSPKKGIFSFKKIDENLIEVCKYN